VIIGKSGSGKTSLLINFLNDNKIYKRVFDKIILCIPEHSYNNMKNNIFEGLPKNQVKHELDFDELSEQILSYAEDDKQTLLIIDDFMAYLKVQRHLIQFNNLIQNRRHYRLSIFLLVQVYNAIPAMIRKSINSIFLFKCNKKEFQNIFEELFAVSKELALKIMKFVYTETHNFLLLDITNQLYYKNLDLILTNEDEEDL
jgi:hypothetical protein